jgi:bacterioferritin (cytochrome b1)
MKKFVRSISDSVNVSGKVEANIIRTVKNAQNLIEDDDVSVELMKKIQRQKEVSIDDIRDRRRLNRLIEYGMVSRLLNNNVVVSGIGSEVLKNIENKD